MARELDETLLPYLLPEGKYFAILNRKNHSQYGKIHANQKNT